MPWRLVDRIQLRLARRRYMPRTRVVKAGTIARVSLGALVLIGALLWVLELHGTRDAATLTRYVRAAGVPPLELVERAALRRRLVFISDVPGSLATKQFFADALERIALGSGLDVVGLEVDAAEQRYIDAYLSTAGEDISILLGRPRAIHEHEGAANAYLAIYRRVRKLNDGFGPDRRIRILALDAEGWPPTRALPPFQLARGFGTRDSLMSLRLQQLLQLNPRTRSLLFVNGLSVQRGGGGLVQTGGTRSIPVTWLAARLAGVYPQDVYTVLVDAPIAGPARIPVARYAGTAVGPLLAEGREGLPIGVVVRPPLSLIRHPVRAIAMPGISFDLTPRTLTLGAVADAYIFLGQ